MRSSKYPPNPKKMRPDKFLGLVGLTENEIVAYMKAVVKVKWKDSKWDLLSNKEEELTEEEEKLLAAGKKKLKRYWEEWHEHYPPEKPKLEPEEPYDPYAKDIRDADWSEGLG